MEQVELWGKMVDLLLIAKRMNTDSVLNRIELDNNYSDQIFNTVLDMLGCPENEDYEILNAQGEIIGIDHEKFSRDGLVDLFLESNITISAMQNVIDSVLNMKHHYEENTNEIR